MMRDIGAYFYYGEKQHMSTEIIKAMAFVIGPLSQFSVDVLGDELVRTLSSFLLFCFGGWQPPSSAIVFQNLMYEGTLRT